LRCFVFGLSLKIKRAFPQTKNAKRIFCLGAAVSPFANAHPPQRHKVSLAVDCCAGATLPNAKKSFKKFFSCDILKMMIPF
jgi:hypothetical protein